MQVVDIFFIASLSNLAPLSIVENRPGLQSASSPSHPKSTPRSASPQSDANKFTDIPVTNIRHVIARRLTESKVGKIWR